MKMHLCVMALSDLDKLDLIIGKGLGVRILAFETRSWSVTILWSMLAAGNSYYQKEENNQYPDWNRSP